MFRRSTIMLISGLLFNSCSIKPEKLIGTYTGTCEGTLQSYVLPENGLWQISKDTIILFSDKEGTTKDTLIYKRMLFPKRKSCTFTKE
ncbi:MAG: hypothetical protein K1X55_11560 [Chitinophagales bacterium]|nr:hypothetical protein [Chitinophagales bacterium]